MKKFAAGMIAVVFVIVFCVTALPLLFSAATAPVYACNNPTDPSGRVTLGSGVASDAYFAIPWLGRVEERKDIAKKIIAVGRLKKETDYSIQTALETGLQESGLLNLTKGDRDSLGVFQQRPSAGWGTREQILNVTDSTSAFFAALDKVPNKDTLSYKAAAIVVQRPSLKAYASWHWDEIGHDLITGSSAETCVASGDAHLPLDPGYHVSDGFADPRPDLSIGSKPHIGIDMVYGSNTRGKPVYAALSGVVVQSGFGGGCNKSNNNPVMILSADGLEIGYLHMNGADIIVKKGDHVAAGQQIGAIGSCGQSTGPHLHFEVTPVSDHDAWLSAVKSVQKYGSTWLDPEGVLAHYGVKLLP